MKKLYFLALWLFTIVLTAIFFSWGYRHITLADGKRFPKIVKEFILGVAAFPILVKQSIQETINFDDRLVIDITGLNRASWSQNFPSKTDTGYLLLAAYDPLKKISNIKLTRVSDGVVMHVWSADLKKIQDVQKQKRALNVTANESSGRLSHPLLLSDGSIVAMVDGVLLRISKSNQNTSAEYHQVHHSLALDAEGYVWSPTVLKGFYQSNQFLDKNLEDNGVSKFSIDGKLLFQKSFSQIMYENNLEGLLLGQFGFAFNKDPIHINQVTPALSDGKYWKKGDLLISARHLSTVFLYRPSTNKIIWYKTGPWFNQHSSLFIDDHRISVFNNNVISGVPSGNEFFGPVKTNRAFIYDFSTNQVTEPFAKAFEKAGIRTITEGRLRILSDGRAFVEETNWGRHLMLSKDDVIWERINYVDSDHIGVVNWSRYLTKEEVDPILPHLK